MKDEITTKECNSASESVDAMKKRFNIKKDSELALIVGVSRQSIYQFRKRGKPDVAMKIIELLLKNSVDPSGAASQ